MKNILKIFRSFAFIALIAFCVPAKAQTCCNGYILYKALNYSSGYSSGDVTSNSVCMRSYNDSRYFRVANKNTASNPLTSDSIHALVPTTIYIGTVTPNSNIVGSVGNLYISRADTTIYIKMTGTATNTGWVGVKGGKN